MKSPAEELLIYWDRVSDTMVNNEKYPSFTLSFDEYYSISCEVKKDGTMKFSTSYSGGHGEGSWVDKGRSGNDWKNLITEANLLGLHYWGMDYDI